MMAPRLLHNMSVRPRTRLFHPEETSTRSHGVGLVFRFSADDWGEDPRRLAGLLGIGVAREADAEQTLRKCLDEHVRQMPLPDACLVTEHSVLHDSTCACDLAGAAVMSKSSGNIFLKQKQPSLYGIGPPIVLLLSDEQEVQEVLRWVRLHEADRELPGQGAQA
ncbi:MAG: hypothetical protein MK004_05095 [Planctomycetales bacterium]|nr:hypothetical protein [Planctomycetales bacterium]